LLPIGFVVSHELIATHLEFVVYLLVVESKPNGELHPCPDLVVNLVAAHSVQC